MKVATVLFVLIWIADAKKDKYKHSFNQIGKSAELKCAEKEIIFNISLTSKNEANDCYGLQVPVLVSTLKCYWKNGCNITLDKEDIISQVDGQSNVRCIGEKPDVLLYDFSCIPEDVVTDSIHVTKSKISSSYGIIKSHERYPWNYEAKLKTHTVGSATLHRPRKKKILYMKYINYDVNHVDKVTVSYNNTAVEEWDHGVKVIKDMKTIHLNFTVKPGTKFGGFLICYMWVRSEKDAKDFATKPCNDYSKPPKRSKNNFNPESGTIVGPTTIKRPCMKRKGCKKALRKLRYLRIGIVELKGDVKYKYTKKRKEKEGRFSKQKPFKVKSGTMKRIKSIEIIDVPENTELCFVWEDKYNTKPLSCS